MKKVNRCVFTVLLMIALISQANAADVSGRVKDTAGTGVVSTVYLLDSARQLTTYSAATDSSGNYVITSVAAGRYFVRAVPSGSSYLTGETRSSYNVATSNVNVDIVLSASTPANARYVGSSSCRFCHNTSNIGGLQFNSWKNTWHANAIHDPDPAKHGSAKEGIIGNFGQDPVLSESANKITNVTIDLNFDGVDYTVRIGNVTYRVDKVMGGYWKQRYLTKIGNSYYVLPVQWNIANSKWVNYDLLHWFKTDGSNAPLYESGETPVSRGNQKNSWDRRCAGCHAASGLNVSINAQGEYVASFTEMKVSCENCHGAASEHNVDGGGKANDIIMPNLLAYERANEVCGQCHNRGTAVSQPGTTSFDYPYNTNTGLFKPSLTLDDFFKNYKMNDPAAGATNFWRADKAYPEEGLSSGDAIAGRAHREQWPELLGKAKHANNPSELVSCFECHAPHGSSNMLQLVEQSRGKKVTDATSLCLSCHQKLPPFQNDTSLIGIADGDADHFSGIYDAMKGIGCIECHMVKTGRTAIGPDAITKEFDEPSHTFEAIKPKFSTNTMPNACTKCHTSGGAAFTSWDLVEAQRVFEMTNASVRELSSTYVGVDFCRICHTSTTGIPQVYDGWNTTRHSDAFNRKLLPQILNASGNDSSVRSCLPCHTAGYGKGGYVNYNTTPQLANIQCENCHGAGGKHDVEANVSSRVCGECHIGVRRPTIDEWESSGHAQSLLRIKGRKAATYSACLRCHSADYRLSKNPAAIPDATNTTKYGVTCAVCHDSHSTANESQLRAVNATQMCAQCHFNYDNRGPGYVRAPHNFQYEMRQGRGGVDVDSIQFMPTVGCDDCHMLTRVYATGSPAITGHTFEPNATACKQCHIRETNLKGDDGSDTLKRHTALNILRSGRFDCGLCHEKGFSAQGYLDTWQARISDEINKTQANVTLAKNAATTGALKDLYNKSKFNLDIVASSDKTKGAHNPDYAMALLRKSSEMANQVIAGQVPTPTVTPPAGTQVAVSDTTGVPLANTTVAIRVTNVTNLAAGTLTLSFNPSVVQVVSVSAGDLGSPTSNVNNAAGTATITVFSTTGVSGNVVIASVVLNVVGAIGSTSPLTLSVANLADQNGAAITHTVSSGTLTVSAVQKGDVNSDGEVTVVDALFVAQYTVGIRTLTSSQLAAADVNGDGQVTVVDALFIAQATVGLRTL